MNKARAILVAALVSMTLGTAFGQSYKTFDMEWNEIRDRTKFRVGPLRFIPDFRLTDIGYDDNVYFLSPGENPVGDYIGTASLEVKSSVLFGRSLILSVTENPEYQYFAKETSLRRFTNSFALDARLLLFNRLAFSGRHHFQKHQRRASNEFTSLVTDTDKGESFAAFYETPRGTAIGVTRSVSRFLYEDIILPEGEIPLSRSLNREESITTVEFYYPVFAESHFFVTTGATDYEFDDPAYRWRNSRSFQVTSGIRFPLLGRARGTLSLGYKKFTPGDRTRKTYSGLIADTHLDFRFGRFEFRFDLGRNNYFSYLENALYFIEDRLSPGISVRLTRRFRLDYDFNYGRLRYPETFGFPGPGGEILEIARRDSLRVHAIGFTVFFFRRMGIHVSYNIFERDSNVPGLARKRNFIGLNLTRDF